jgi:hypothetical protein
MVVHNIVNYLILEIYYVNPNVQQNFCNNPVVFNTVNLSSYMVIEILPFMSVAVLNYKNFRQMSTIKTDNSGPNLDQTFLSNNHDLNASGQNYLDRDQNPSDAF